MTIPVGSRRPMRLSELLPVSVWGSESDNEHDLKLCSDGSRPKCFETDAMGSSSGSCFLAGLKSGVMCTERGFCSSFDPSKCCQYANHQAHSQFIGSVSLMTYCSCCTLNKVRVCTNSLASVMCALPSLSVKGVALMMTRNLTQSLGPTRLLMCVVASS